MFKKRTTWTPKLVLSYRSQTGETFFHPADEAAMKAFFGNIRKFDEGGFKAVVTQAAVETEGGVATLTVEDLRSALRAGETLFTGYVADGPERACGFCGQSYQPRVLNEFEKAPGIFFVGGNIGVFKRDVLLGIAENLKATRPTLAERVVKVAEAMTAEVTGGDTAPLLTLLTPACPDCQPNFYGTYVALASAKDALAYVDKRVDIADSRRAIRAAMETVTGRPARPQRAVGGGFRPERSSGRHDDRRGRERSERVEWHGASLEPETAHKLTEAGYVGLDAAIRAAESGELLAKGIAHIGSIQAITFALTKAKGNGNDGNRPVAGTARAVLAPGAPRPEVASRRSRTVTVSVAPGKGGKKGRSRSAGVNLSGALS